LIQFFLRINVAIGRGHTITETLSHHMKILIHLAALSLLCLSTYAVPAKPAPKEFDGFQLITGFHSHFDKSNGFEFRILEVDGSATAAMNPVDLYLVVTNNASGADLQSMIVRLPKVSEIKSIRFTKDPGIIQIHAFIDKLDDDLLRQRKESVTLYVSVPIKGRKLPPVIDVYTK
jgi:hypothetical protein